jgi:hypothetical protein
MRVLIVLYRTKPIITCIVEQGYVLCPTVSHGLIHDSGATSALTRDCHTCRIATKRLDVLLHPLQGKVHIQKPCVESTIRLDILTRQESECAETILNDYRDEAIVVRGDKLGWIEALSAEESVPATISRK